MWTTYRLRKLLIAVIWIVSRQLRSTNYFIRIEWDVLRLHKTMVWISLSILIRLRTKGGGSRWCSSYYFAVLQRFKQPLLFTSISPAQRCRSINELLNSTIMAWPKIRQVKYYLIPCQTQFDLLCFFDELYMCPRTLEYHANCFKFDHKPDLTCPDKTHGQNGAECFQHVSSMIYYATKSDPIQH